MRILTLRERGQGVVEIAIILAIIAILIIVVFPLVEKYFTENSIADAATALDSQASNTPQETVVENKEKEPDQTIEILKYIVLASILGACIFIGISIAMPLRTPRDHRHRQKSWKGKRSKIA